MRPISGGMAGGPSVGGEVFRPSQTDLATFTLAPGACQDFDNGVWWIQTICNHPRRLLGGGVAAEMMNIYVKKMPAWVYEATTLFRSRGGNASRPEDYTPEEFRRVQEMAAFVQQPAPTPNGRIVWQK